MSESCNKFHDAFENEENHHIQAFCYTTQTDRLAATSYEVCPGQSKTFDASDVGKVAKQENVNSGDGNVTFWALSSHSPVEWVELTNKTVPPDVDVKVGVSANDTTAGYLGQKLSVSTGSNASQPIATQILNGSGNEILDIKLDTSKIDHNSLINSGGNRHIDWTANAGAQINTANYLNDRVRTSALDGQSKFLEDALVAGANINITKNSSGGIETLTLSATGELDSDCPTVQARRTTLQNFSSIWSDVNLDTTDVENVSTSLSHDNTNRDRIVAIDAGLYYFHFHVETEIFSQGMFKYQLRKNDTVAIPGSEQSRSDGGDIFLNSLSCSVILDAGDWVSFQIQSVGGSARINPGTTVVAIKCAGAKGEKGDPGTGSSVDVKSGGSLVTGSPFSTLNFSSDFNVTNQGSGQTQIALGQPTNVFGTEFQEVSDVSSSSTNSTGNVFKLRLTTPIIPAGKYRLGFTYGWRHSSTGSDFRARVQLNNNTDLFFHNQEPKDTGSNQAYRTTSFVYVTLTNASHFFDLDFGVTSGGTATIGDTKFEFWRVS